MSLAPEARAWLEQIRAYQAPDARSAPGPAARIRGIRAGIPRRDTAEFLVEGLARVADGAVPVEGGTVTARVYTPSGTGPFPVHVFFHGGAFLFGSALDESTDASMQARAVESGSLVVNVDYRLAPEYRFPVGVEDAYAAVVWAARNAADLNGDGTRLSVGGVSSGGNFAAAVSVMTRDRNGPKLILQLLEVPATDLTKCSRAWREGHPDFDMTREADLALMDMYVRTPLDKANPYASPLMAADLSGLPPAYIMSAEFDPRRDESEAYATRLRDAGVEAVSRTMTGHFHASFMLTDTWEGARKWAREANAALRHANEKRPARVFDDFVPAG